MVQTIEMCFWQSYFKFQLTLYAYLPKSAKKQLVMSAKLLFTGRETTTKRQEKWLWTHFALQQTLVKIVSNRPMMTNYTFSGHFSVTVTYDSGIYCMYFWKERNSSQNPWQISNTYGFRKDAHVFEEVHMYTSAIVNATLSGASSLYTKPDSSLDALVSMTVIYIDIANKISEWDTRLGEV